MAGTALIATGFILGLVYLLYRWALPKPIPGIPYSKESAGRLLGDIPSLVADMKQRGDLFLWFRDQNLQSGSVVNQVFTNPLGKPLLIVADARETRDILVHRSGDFDRTVFVSDMLRPIIGQGQITLPTGPAWKARRRLSQDTMSARFLRNVAAPNIHASCATFVRLWEEKLRLAGGRPFDAEADLFHATLDAVNVFTYGSQYPYRAVRPRLEALAALSAGDIQLGPREDDPAVFPHCEIDVELQNVIDFIERAEAVQATGFQYLGWYYESMTTRYKKLKRARDECIRREVRNAVERMKDLDERTAEETARHGVDLILNRERIMAGKENRQPDYFGEAVRGEVFGAIVGGHDTSSSTMCWAVKLLSREQATQTALRRALRSAYAAALEERRQPTVDEVLNTPLPYLDATIEELFRTCAVVPMNSRQATRDTEVLGVPIPGGTVVMHLSAGPGFTMPAYRVDEKLRRAGGGGKEAAWADDDVEAFRPERWLVDGGERCDPNAGPSNGFGQGARSCFGKRLAYMSFRLLLVSVVWNFEMLECPEELSSSLGRFGVVYKPQQTYVRLRKVTL